MPKGYWVGRVDVIKPEGYQAYGVALAEVLRKYGAKFLVRGGTFEAVEGKARGRYRDMGGSGLGDPQIDLAAGVWTLQYNYGPGYAREFLDGYRWPPMSDKAIERLRRRYAR